MTTTETTLTISADLTATQAYELLAEVQYRAAQADYQAGLPWHDNDRIEQARLRAYADRCEDTARKIKNSVHEWFGPRPSN